MELHHLLATSRLIYSDFVHHHHIKQYMNSIPSTRHSSSQELAYKLLLNYIAGSPKEPQIHHYF